MTFQGGAKNLRGGAKQSQGGCAPPLKMWPWLAVFVKVKLEALFSHVNEVEI
jgi:hypothetical protein